MTDTYAATLRFLQIEVSCPHALSPSTCQRHLAEAHCQIGAVDGPVCWAPRSLHAALSDLEGVLLDAVIDGCHEWRGSYFVQNLA